MGNGLAVIVEDHPLNAELLTRLLNTEQMDSVIVNRPSQLLSLLEKIQGQATVIFLDLELPEYDGYELLKQLKIDARCVGIPVIAYTVHTSDMKKAHEAGFDGFLGKPLDAGRFGTLLKQILNGKPVWEA